MSGSARAITLTLSVRDADKLQEQLRSLGTVGEETLRRLEVAAAKPAPALKLVGGTAVEAGNAFGGMTQKIQSAGYQLQDFAVQVQGGTSAMTALSQQGSQFLGAFGPAGAIAGAVLTVGILAMKLLDTAQSVEAVTKAVKAWQAGQEALNAVLDTTVAKQERIARAKVDAAEGPQRFALQQADYDRETAGLRAAQIESAASQRRRDALNETLSRTTDPGARRNIEAVLQRQAAELASAKQTEADADRRVAEAQANLAAIRASGYGPPPSAMQPTGPDRQKELLGSSRESLADARAVAGLSAPQAAIAKARTDATRKADLENLQGAEREEYIRNQVTEATLRQQTATEGLAASQAKQAAAAEKHVAAALQAGNVEVLRSQEQLALQKQLAEADSPRQAFLIQQEALTQRTTTALRARAEAEKDPAIKAALEAQVELITRLRTESQGVEESTRNRTALQQQASQAARQGAEREAVFMPASERARFLGEFNERQKIKDAGDVEAGSAEALLRIKNAGDLAYGDEQLKKLQDFTTAGKTMGSAFENAFEQAIFQGEKFSDVLTALEKQLASAILKATLGKFMDQAISGGVNAAASAIGSYFGGGSIGVNPNAYSSPIGPTQSGVPMANGGVMTQWGSLPLKRYASGGVAHSPQMAVFGEGRSPEAYVPLPDGRSIPVTMKGQAAQTVAGPTIQIDARGAEQGVEARINAVLARRMPAILAATRTDMSTRINSGGDLARVVGRR